MEFLYAVKELDELGDVNYSYCPFVAHSDRNALEYLHAHLSSIDNVIYTLSDNLCVFCIGMFDRRIGTVSGYGLHAEKMVFRLRDVMTNYSGLCDIYPREKEGDSCE